KAGHVEEGIRVAAAEQVVDSDIASLEGALHGTCARDMTVTGTLHTVEDAHQLTHRQASQAHTVPITLPATISPGKCTPSSTREQPTAMAHGINHGYRAG